MTAPPAKILLALIGALALGVLLVWVGPTPDEGTAPAPAIGRAAKAAAALPPRQAALWASRVLARPLFSISRRPARENPKHPGEAAPGQARLSGIMVGRFGRRAIFAPEGGGKPLVLAEGASVNESTIARIMPNAVILASGAELRPSFDHNRQTNFTPAFQPGVPAFPNPNFPNNGFVPPGLQPPPQPPPADNDTGAAQPTAPLLPNPMFRGQTMPQRRDQ